MARTLHPHQAIALDKLRTSLKTGHRRPLLQMPTGAGKTVLASEIVNCALQKGNPVLFTVPAVSLIDQTYSAFFQAGIYDLGVMQGNHPQTKASAAVQIASVQTLRNRKIPNAVVVVIDECFTGDTKVLTPSGEKRIDEIAVGDTVMNATGSGNVAHVFRKHARTLTVKLSNGETVHVTEKHPFLTLLGWTKAGELEVGTRLFSCEAVRGLWSRNASLDREDGQGAGRGGLSREAFLYRVMREEAGEPDAQSGLGREGVSHAPAHRSRAEDALAAAGPNEASGDYASGVGRWLGARAFGADWREEGLRDSDIIQARLGVPWFEAQRRTGRRVARGQAAGAGQEAGRALGDVRVESISRDERESAEPVYNLHVTGHPSYFAAGVLVHNCHRWFDFYGDWMRRPEWEKTPFIGLSATPWTKGLGNHFDDLIIGETTAGLIDKGFLSPFRAFAPASGVKPDLSDIRTVAGDYHEGMLAAEMSKAPLVADIVRTWLEKGEARPTLVFAVNRAHAKLLQEQFQKAGVSTEYVDADTPREERGAIGRRLQDGRAKVVVNIGCLTTGVDWPFVSCIILARPTKSAMLYTQIVGRGLRTDAGKTDLLLLDHSDTTSRLGFVTDINHDALDGGKLSRSKSKPQEPREKALPKECLACGYLKPAGVRKCPDCGFEARKPSNVEHVEGELKQVKGTAQKADKRTKQGWFSAFLGIANERGYKQGWAANKYREKFGVWPRGLDEIFTYESLTGVSKAEVQNFVKSRQIAFSKATERRAA